MHRGPRHLVAVMLVVVGLGNPGREYAAHRHNVGFMVVDQLASRARADAFREKFSGGFARAELGPEPAVLLKPQTFMNESGRSVQPALAFFKAAPNELLVVHDELDLPFGTVRLKFGGGHAGHNGLRSIVGALGTGDFGRVRVGIGRPPPEFRGDPADFVLSRFDPVETAELPDLLQRGVETVLEVASRGLQAAMNVRNTRPRAAAAAPPTAPRPQGSGNGGSNPPEKP